MQVVSSIAAQRFFVDLPGICALRETSQANLVAWNTVALSFFRYLCDLERPCRLLAAREDGAGRDDALDPV
ncbi:unnamed protein product [Durusdinium trenchii]|uniref:Uncharacterized protein n=1 Tax=Durusdinium trenchii TaxID=1381693 RepID=A0ABP0SP00_9DINO